MELAAALAAKAGKKKGRDKDGKLIKGKEDMKTVSLLRHFHSGAERRVCDIRIFVLVDTPSKHRIWSTLSKKHSRNDCGETAIFRSRRALFAHILL